MTSRQFNRVSNLPVHFTRPARSNLDAFLEQQRTLDYTYKEVGATAATPPAGYNVDHTRIEVGRGEDDYQEAASAIRRWDHFRLGWVEPYPGDSPIQPDEMVGVVARAAGLCWVNACRIVYVIDEPHAKRFGYAYGTLPGHVERGEERFLVEIDAEGKVWYDILAFSQPRHLLPRLAYPWARRLQRRFGRDSASALIRGMRQGANRPSI